MVLELTLPRNDEHMLFRLPSVLVEAQSVAA